MDREECPSLCDVIRRGLTFHISSLEEIRHLKYSSSNRCPEGGLHGQCRGRFRRGRKDGLSSMSTLVKGFLNLRLQIAVDQSLAVESRLVLWLLCVLSPAPTGGRPRFKGVLERTLDWGEEQVCSELCPHPEAWETVFPVRLSPNSVQCGDVGTGYIRLWFSF